MCLCVEEKMNRIQNDEVSDTTDDATKNYGSLHKNSQQFPMHFSQNIGMFPKYWESLSDELLQNVKS